MSFLKSFTDGDLAAGAGPGPGGGGGVNTAKIITVDRAVASPLAVNTGFIIQFDKADSARYAGGRTFMLIDVDATQVIFKASLTNSFRISVFHSGGQCTMSSNIGNISKSTQIARYGLSDRTGNVPTSSSPVLIHTDPLDFPKGEIFIDGDEVNFVAGSGNISTSRVQEISLEIYVRKGSRTNSNISYDNFAPVAQIRLISIWSHATMAENPSIPWDNMGEMRKLIYPEGGGPVNGPGETGSGIMGVQPDIFLWGGGEDPLKNDADGKAITITSAAFPSRFTVKNGSNKSIGKFL